MSFGPAAGSAGGFASPAADDRCPCGSGDRYDACCRPLLRREPAPTAERLMRSRYTAFVVGDARHLCATWHPRTRPHDLVLDPAQRWTGLEIIDVVAGAEGDDEGCVEFRARWRHGRDQGELHERSRFVRRAGRWTYVDGTVDEVRPGPPPRSDEPLA
ncbi:YchJ family protein [Microbacterium sp. CPCC 204701]|uniref:YchJ family protein n=1 Tax=Microbacterium sp. CPCC 204701 TaxID=2493084 RepID=UPI000FD83A3C|nr:YchJ family metal-binding protein [Microbacterium sp. CPCC 204701]